MTELFIELFIGYRNLHDAVILQHEDDIKELRDVYITALNNVREESNARILTSQFIARFLKCYPCLVAISVKTMLELCLDKDPKIREQAFLDLPAMCSENLEYTWYTLQVLVRLLHIPSPKELKVVHKCMRILMNERPSITLKAIFENIAADDLFVRKSCIRFLLMQVKPAFSDYLSAPLGPGAALAEVKKALKVLLPKHCASLLSFLSGYNSGQLITHYEIEMEIESIYQEKSKLNHKSLSEMVKNLKDTVHLFSVDLPSDIIYDFFMDIVTSSDPEFKQLCLDDDTKLEVLRLMAQMFRARKTVDYSEEICKVYKLLKEFMPCPDEPTGEVLKYLHVEPLCFILKHCTVKSSSPFKDMPFFQDLEDRSLHFLEQLIKPHEDNVSILESVEYNESFFYRPEFIRVTSIINIKDVFLGIFANRHHARVYYSWYYPERI